MTELLNIDAGARPPAAETGYFKMGASKSPGGAEITVNSRSLLRDGKPWAPVMGEFHFTRYPETEWRDELLKMKAGGIDIIATYVFWIHHEEIEGEWDWSGRRGLRQFAKMAQEAGLDLAVRIGPWCHGEVRNGGHPDWLPAKGWKIRADDPPYLDKARILYGQIAAQLEGLLWKDGGPVVAIQIENEYGGPAEHLLTLKKIARDAGLDTPLYTRTGWPALSTPMPLGELLPLYGAYAEGFWDREITSMPGDYWSKFHFSLVRTDTAIASEIFGARKEEDPPETARYPYLTCEIGGGMAVSYHRRVLIDPRDVESTTLVKIGSGGNLPGYYMCHGGTNPDGKVTSLQESQATGMANDLPEKGYDFQAPLGEFGQVRPHFHGQRLLHLFLRDFGARFAGMTPRLPKARPAGKDDTQTPRWAVRSDGESALLFVNNYERSREMPAREATRFRIKLASREIIMPSEPVTIPAGGIFFWPLNFDLGGLKLLHATAQPICQIENDGKIVTFFAEAEGVPAEFAFEMDVTTTGAKTVRDGMTIVKPRPGVGAAVEARDHLLVLLDAKTARDCYKASWLGKERVFLSSAVVVPDGDTLRLLADGSDNITLRMLPALDTLKDGDRAIPSRRDGLFRGFALPPAERKPLAAEVEQIQAAGPPRKIALGKIKTPVAAAPVDSDFAQAAIWRVKLPADLDRSRDYLLRVRYQGDVIRAYLGERFLTDDFYNGNPFELGLKRYAPEIYHRELLFKILPLRKDAPIFLAEKAKPRFGDDESAIALHGIDIIERHEARLTAG